MASGVLCNRENSGVSKYRLVRTDRKIGKNQLGGPKKKKKKEGHAKSPAPGRLVHECLFRKKSDLQKRGAERTKKIVVLN